MPISLCYVVVQQMTMWVSPGSSDFWGLFPKLTTDLESRWWMSNFTETIRWEGRVIESKLKMKLFKESLTNYEDRLKELERNLKFQFRLILCSRSLSVASTNTNAVKIQSNPNLFQKISPHRGKTSVRFFFYWISIISECYMYNRQSAKEIVK